ncbi:hypothetical protein ABIA32_000133 [Streptacidiphilus sp. MAP12-20]|uniref:anti-sigma factor family protein n=1 Tax=Streptacidiphilus sp. MAP12-20 TaxID=3156299 RepID=UPI0035133C00
MSESTVHPAHPEVELISEHLEGLLSDEQSAELAAHLRDCPDCRETHDALIELRDLLGAEPDPGPMPDDVAARIDAALAEARDSEARDNEAPDSEATGDSTGDAADESGMPRPTRRPADNRPAGRSRGRLRLRRALTTLAIFVAAGGIGLAVSSGGDIDGGASTSANSGAGSAAAPRLTGDANTVYEFTTDGLNAQIQTLVRDQARLQLSSHGAAATVPGATPTAPPSPADHSSPTTPQSAGKEAAIHGPTAPACVLAATKQSTPPQVQGFGHYLGVQVFALLYPVASDPHHWDVYLVQNSCASPLLLFHQLVPRA